MAGSGAAYPRCRPPPAVPRRTSLSSRTRRPASTVRAGPGRAHPCSAAGSAPPLLLPPPSRGRLPPGRGGAEREGRKERGGRFGPSRLRPRCRGWVCVRCVRCVRGGARPPGRRPRRFHLLGLWVGRAGGGFWSLRRLSGSGWGGSVKCFFWARVVIGLPLICWDPQVLRLPLSCFGGKASSSALMPYIQPCTFITC